MKFKDIPQLTRKANYRINMSWRDLESCFDRWTKDRNLAKLDLDPEFQRGHVWTESQQIAYVEFILRGGSGSNDIQFNCVGWMNSFEGPFVLVDGKQRLTAVLKFLRSELKVFGHYYNEFEDDFRWGDCEFIFHVNDLKSMQEVYRWYLEMNSGGTPHTEEELDKVRKLIL